MSAQERILFEAKLTIDPDLSQAYEQFKEVLYLVKEQEAQNLKGKLVSLDAELDRSLVVKSKLNKIIQYSLIAGAAILVMVVTVFVLERNSISPAVAFNERDIGLPVTMGESSNRELDKAMSYYKQNHYRQSEALLKELAVQKSSDTITYYIGINEYELGHFSKAISYFNSVSPSSSFYDKALYRLGLAYWQTGNLDEARQVFLKLQSLNSPYKQTAEVILKKIK